MRPGEISTVAHRIRGALSGRRTDHDLQREIAGHLALAEDELRPVGFIPGTSGIFDVGRRPTGEISEIRFFEYASRTSFDLAPANQVAGLAVPVLALPADGRRRAVLLCRP